MLQLKTKMLTLQHWNQSLILQNLTMTPAKRDRESVVKRLRGKQPPWEVPEEEAALPPLGW
eukprot:11966705-Prorocentrum_lima.AAC.1